MISVFGLLAHTLNPHTRASTYRSSFLLSYIVAVFDVSHEGEGIIHLKDGNVK